MRRIYMINNEEIKTIKQVATLCNVSTPYVSRKLANLKANESATIKNIVVTVIEKEVDTSKDINNVPTVTTTKKTETEKRKSVDTNGNNNEEIMEELKNVKRMLTLIMTHLNITDNTAILVGKEAENAWNDAYANAFPAQAEYYAKKEAEKAKENTVINNESVDNANEFDVFEDIEIEENTENIINEEENIVNNEESVKENNDTTDTDWINWEEVDWEVTDENKVDIDDLFSDTEPKAEEQQDVEKEKEIDLNNNNTWSDFDFFDDIETKENTESVHNENESVNNTDTEEKEIAWREVAKYENNEVDGDIIHCYSDDKNEELYYWTRISDDITLKVYENKYAEIYDRVQTMRDELENRPAPMRYVSLRSIAQGLKIDTEVKEKRIDFLQKVNSTLSKDIREYVEKNIYDNEVYVSLDGKMMIRNDIASEIIYNCY